MVQGGFLAHHFDDDIGISKYRELEYYLLPPPVLLKTVLLLADYWCGGKSVGGRP
jgi:hypothetical protein